MSEAAAAVCGRSWPAECCLNRSAIVKWDLELLEQLHRYVRVSRLSRRNGNVPAYIFELQVKFDPRSVIVDGTLSAFAIYCKFSDLSIQRHVTRIDLHEDLRHVVDPRVGTICATLGAPIEIDSIVQRCGLGYRYYVGCLRECVSCWTGRAWVLLLPCAPLISLGVACAS